MRMAGARRGRRRGSSRAEGVTRIVASPLQRARQTAEPLAERLGLSIKTIEDWAEADRGSIRYRSTETLRAEGGDAWSRFLADPIGYLGGDPAIFRAAVLARARRDRRERTGHGPGRSLHAWPADQHRAVACARTGKHHAISRRLRLRDPPEAFRRRAVWRRQHQ